MNKAVMFGRATDEWTTPRDFFQQLDREFKFTTDVACTPENKLCAYGIHSALDTEWSDDGDYSRAVCFMNPPYSKVRQFMAKAREESLKGATVVCLVPARTDTRWWHEWVYYGAGMWWPGVEVRFIKGRLKFGNSENGAPFPSVVIVFRPPQDQR